MNPVITEEKKVESIEGSLHINSVNSSNGYMLELGRDNESYFVNIWNGNPYASSKIRGNNRQSLVGLIFTLGENQTTADMLYENTDGEIYLSELKAKGFVRELEDVTSVGYLVVEQILKENKIRKRFY
ncbi:hypothetical protein GF361_04855 [Candidatus Woesearchaeota archaeon]|nr:hypothetical protein [Candidatus Woesearchaeota archaeon]